MSLTPTEITLQEALSDCGLRALPKECKPDGNTVWITAIALVTKIGGRKEYVKCVNDGGGTPSIVRDYGTCAAIVSVNSIHPVDVLDKRFTPDLRSNETVIKFLSKNGYDESAVALLLSKEGKTPEQAKEDRAAVRGYVNKVAITLAKKTLAEEARCRDIKDYANRIKHGTEEGTED